MPLFEYICKACGHKFEELVGSANETAQCPNCQSTDTGKQLSVFSASTSAGQSSGPACSRPGCGSGFS